LRDGALELAPEMRYGFRCWGPFDGWADGRAFDDRIGELALVGTGERFCADPQQTREPPVFGAAPPRGETPLLTNSIDRWITSRAVRERGRGRTRNVHRERGDRGRRRRADMEKVWFGDSGRT